MSASRNITLSIPIDFCDNIAVLSEELNKKITGDPDHDSSEQYVYLGMMNDTYFYIHTVHNTEFKEPISHQIYNVMIDETMITEPKSNVIIYEFYPDGTQKAIIIQHASNSIKKVFSSDNLREFFNTLIAADRRDMFVIVYDYDKKCYFTYEIDSPPPPINLDPIRSLSLDYVVTDKSL